MRSTLPYGPRCAFVYPVDHPCAGYPCNNLPRKGRAYCHAHRKHEDRNEDDIDTAKIRKPGEGKEDEK